MDKNKNRTDLLAAGRKKLQQFRQKKDNKGGKSSGKAGRSGSDASTNPANVPATRQYVPDAERPLQSSNDAVSSSEPCTTKVHVDSNSNVPSVDELDKAGTTESSSRTGELEIQNDLMAETEANVCVGDPCEGNPGETLDPRVDEERLNDIQQEPSNPDSEQVDATSEVEIEGEKKHSLNEPGYGSNDLTITDVGEHGMKKENNETVHPSEPDDATSIDIKSKDAEERDEHSLPPEALHESVSAVSSEVTEVGEHGMRNEKNEIIHPSEPDDGTSIDIGSKDAEERDGHSIPPESLHESDSAVSAEVVCSQVVGVSTGFSSGETIQIPCVSTDYDGGHMERANSSDFVNNDSEKYVNDKITNSSSGQNASSINLQQLAEIVRSLNEDEFKFLFMSRDSAVEKFRTAEALFGSTPLVDVFERMKEQLYLSNLVKDVKSLQLSEELEFQIYEAKASVTELGDKNVMLANELAQVRSESQIVATEKDEIQKQFQNSKAEVLQLSAQADELQIKLNMTKEDLDNLSAELVGCRNLVSALEVEKENLNEKLNLISYENKQLQEERRDFLLEIEKLGAELAQSKASFLSLQLENQGSIDSLTSLNDERWKLEMEKENFVCENEKLLAEVADCKKIIEVLHAEKTNAHEILMSITEEKEKLLEEKHSLLNDTGKLVAELKESKASVEALQMEVSETKAHLTSSMEEANKLEDEKQQILTKNEELFQEFTESKILVAYLQAQCSVAVDDLKSATLQIEQLTEENKHLYSSLTLQNSKITEFDCQNRSPSQSEEAGNQFTGAPCVGQVEGSVIDDDVPSSVSREGNSVKLFTEIRESSSDHMHNGFLRVDVIRRNLDEAEGVLEKLEKKFEEIQSHLSSISCSSREAVTPRISKLIQAFESKGHADDHLPEGGRLSENQSAAHPCVLTKQQIGDLRALLKNVLLESQNACKCFEEEMRNKLHNETVLAESKAKYESLIEHTDHLEHENMVFMVLNETLGQYISDTKSKEGEFMALYDALQKEEITLKEENNHLREKLSDSQTRTSELKQQLNEMQQSCDEMVFAASNQVETLKKEVAERKSVQEEVWNSLVSEVMELLIKLDLSVVPAGSSSLFSERERGLDHHALASHIATSVNNAIKEIETLQGQVEVARSDQEAALTSFYEINKRFEVLQGEKEMVIGLIYRIYSNLTELVNEMSDQDGGNESNTRNEKLVDPLIPGVLDTLLEKLQKLNSERLRLEAMNCELASELDKRKDSSELKKCSLDSESILKYVEYVERVIALDGVDINVNEPAVCVQSLIHFLMEKYIEAVEQVNLFTERDASKEKQSVSLQKQMDELSFLFTQLENENFILKESLRKVKEEAVALNSQLHEKVSETEQSDQRVASLREKLSIAVSRGKSLIVQRDSLKQSLAETSSELERCTQELHLKDSRLHELEMKLKTNSEAGERVEALESELSYIRNSSTALRESFLLKDSVLQRIEEILEDLELPEHFHSKGILEKIDWLAKSVSGNSLHLTDWDQKSAVGGSYPESETAVLESWKEDTQPSMNSFEDLRVKYEDLQNKFYRLAEQNEMLEQSLMERNNLVQHWEGILDTIEMPSQLRSVEPNDKISWLAFALSEAQNYCNSLQQKSDNFEALFEESNRRLSDLEASLESVVNENEVLSRNLDTLTRDNEKFSEKAVHFEVENNNLHQTIKSLQEKLNEMFVIEERVQHILGEIQRLQDLVRNALQDDITDHELFSADGINYLEKLLRMLVDKYTALSVTKAVNEDTTVERVMQEIDSTEHESRDAEDRDVAALNRKLESALGDVMCLKEERERFAEKNQSLVSEVEALNLNKKELQELLIQEELMNQSLVSKVEALIIDKKDLLQLLSQEEQKNQSMVSEVEDLNMNMKELQELLRQEELKNHSLVAEVDALNMKKKELQELLSQQEPENLSLVSEVEALSLKNKELQELLSQQELNYHSLVSEVEALSMKNKELQELLNQQEMKYQSLVSEVEALNINKKELQGLLSQEELKSASLREKLNVAVRKGKSLVQLRDSLNKSIEELNMEVENLKSKMKLQENVISGYEERKKDQSTFEEKIRSIESDSVLLQTRLAETEHSLQEKDNILSIILNAFDEFDVGVLSTISSPLEKAKHVGMVCHNLQSALTSSEQEAKKSKRAAELLLAELNEVQERNDGLQEDLANALDEVSNLSKERDSADAAKNEAIANLENMSAAYSELKTSMDQLKDNLSNIRSSVSDVLLKDLGILRNLGASLKACLESRDAPIDFALTGTAAPGGTYSITSASKAFMVELSSINEMLDKHSRLVHDEASHISEIMVGIHEEITLQKKSFESMKIDAARLESIEKEKDSELLQMRRYHTLLYEACTSSIMEIENWRKFSGNNLATSAPGDNLISWHSAGGGLTNDTDFYSEESIRSVGERLLVAVKDIMNMQMELSEDKQKDIKAAMLDLQKELQEKDIQREKICRELVSQIKEAEAVSNNYLEELRLAKAQVNDLQRQGKLMEEEQTKLENKIKEMQDQESAFADAQRRVKSLEDMVAAKEQENEALMQALDEEEAQMEDMSNKIGELEKVVLQKNKDMENLEVSRGKALKKLSVTVTKFDELHHLSENLLSEVESLQSQLQERDGEISFLRQEVTRCTNDALAASQMSNKRSSDEIHDLLTWLDKTISVAKTNDANLDNSKVNEVHDYKDRIQKQVMSIVSELEGLRVATQSKDLQLQEEKAKVNELMRKEHILEDSLNQKETQLSILRGAGDSGLVTSTSSEIVELEPLNNKWSGPAPVTSQVRSLRKTNNDHVAIAVDVNPDSGELEDEDDDKAHGFKSLTTSRIVPKFTRPLTDMVDGLWVSCDRALMRQPALRLGVILYWAVIHALLATVAI